MVNKKMLSTLVNATSSYMLFWAGLAKYMHDFANPMLKASNIFSRVQSNSENGNRVGLPEALQLISWNIMLAHNALMASGKQSSKVILENSEKFTKSLMNTVGLGRGEDVEDFLREQNRVLNDLVLEFPEMVKSVDEDFGFQFDTDGYELVDQTDRMFLYRVLPNQHGVETQWDMKPILIGHPYVLGPNILAFLPGEQKSFVHAFANKGIPTYARIIKDINENSAVQTMSGEDDVLDTRRFSELLVSRHEKPLTLAGVCQGGFILMAGLLSGELDGLVDAMITCASPIDGTRSKGLRSYIESISPKFRNLEYSIKTLANGNNVVDGDIMSWVYKLKSIEKESPVFSFFRDFENFTKLVDRGKDSPGKTAAAINHWLVYDRTDLPISITNLSRLSYSVPISGDGELPIRLFGRRLNLKRLEERKIKLLICYGLDDELVEPPSALAPLEFVEAEKTGFPKGHAAIFTSWSDPESEYGLHKVYSNGERGPVKFQLDLDKEIRKKNLEVVK